MHWLGFHDPKEHSSDLQGVTLAQQQAGGGDALMTQGSLVLELSLPDPNRPEVILHFAQDGDWALNLAIRAIPGGGISFVLQQSGRLFHASLNASHQGRSGRVRLTYAWDCGAGEARFSLETEESHRFQLAEFQAPCPWRYQDLRALLNDGPLREVSDSVEFLALSSQMEPIGPAPGLDPKSLVATPQGYRPVEDLQPGDRVLTEEAGEQPVLQVLRREVVARGMFRPVWLRAPFFGLQQDVRLSSTQRIVLQGSEVEYMFGKPAVLVPARHLLGTVVAQSRNLDDNLFTYCQVLLPQHLPITVAGCAIESLYLGGMRRDPVRLKASQLNQVARSRLPEHGPPRFPVLGEFDAVILADRRVA